MKDNHKRSLSNEIGKNLRKLRGEKKITQRQLSEEMNCSEIFISNLEREVTNPSMKTIVNMVNSLNVPLSTILSGEDRNNTTPCQELFNDLSSPKTACVLRMLYDIKKHLIEYENYMAGKENLVAEEIDYEALGQNIERLREEKNLSKVTMAKRLGINEGVYRNIESNNGRASVDRYMEIAEELNVPIDCLFEKSLANKEEISKNYINKIFEDLDDRETQVIKEIAQVVYKILRGHNML